MEKLKLSVAVGSGPGTKPNATIGIVGFRARAAPYNFKADSPVVNNWGIGHWMSHVAMYHVAIYSVSQISVMNENVGATATRATVSAV
ncbi:MAG: hypothetical protein F6J93_32295 [Oscillatoria sp. SIO1A7]|nr:hypothetical protein [Oscillatoria sp. SIO1A7]